MATRYGVHRPYVEPALDHHLPSKPRKQACLACRRRKKRCDGNRPKCSACSGWDVECTYASGSQLSLDNVFPTRNSTPAIDLAAFVENIPISTFDFPPVLSPLSSETLYGVSGDDEAIIDNQMLMDTSQPLSQASTKYFPDTTHTALGPEQTVQLIDEFFERFHPRLPCIHKQAFLNRLRGPQGPILSTPLDWAVLAAAARTHRDKAVSNHAESFLQTAVDLLAQSPLLQENVLRDLQTAVWCVFSLYYTGQITKAVVLLAQAYSLACLNGLNKLDGVNPNIPGAINFSPLEEAECRGALWALFILDRHINHLMGRHFVIDDINWCVDYPLDDRSLQHGLRPEPEPYGPNLAALASQKPGISISVSLHRLLYKTSVILGRIVTYKNINPMPTDAVGARSRLADFHELQSALACLWVSLPACVHNIAEVPAENQEQSVWLLITLHTCSALLFYITDVERQSPGGSNLTPESENFVCAYKSVGKVVAALRRISGLVIDTLLNPMLAPSYFLCCRFILAHWRLSQKQSFRLDLNLVMNLLQRMAETQAGMPQIYKEIIDQELEREGLVGEALARTDHCFLI